jgi:hypothetical protein
VGDSPVDLTKLEFDLLDTLSAHPRVAFSRRQLVERVWDEAWFGDDHIVDVHIVRLRRKLGDDAANAPSGEPDRRLVLHPVLARVNPVGGGQHRPEHFVLRSRGHAIARRGRKRVCGTGTSARRSATGTADSDMPCAAVVSSTTGFVVVAPTVAADPGGCGRIAAGLGLAGRRAACRLRPVRVAIMPPSTPTGASR